MWLELPPGFVKVDLLEGETRERVLAEMTDGFGEEERQLVLDAFELGQDQIRAQRAAQMTLSAAGNHPREDGGVDVSYLSAGVVPAPPGPPNSMLLAVAEQEEARDDNVGVHVVDFPAGPASVADRLIRVATTDLEDAEVEVNVHTIRLTWIAPTNAHLAVVELMSKSTDVWQSYREIMLNLIAPSVTFEHPDVTAQKEKDSAVQARRLNDRLGGNAVPTQIARSEGNDG